MTDLDTGPSSIRDDSICESSLDPNKSSGDIGERLNDIAGLSERQIALYDELAKLDRGDHWLFFTNAGFTMEDARVLHEKGLINATRQMGIPAAQLKRNEQTLTEKLMTLHTEALDDLGLPPETDTVHKQAAAEIERLRRENAAHLKSYNLAIASRLEWRRQAETTNRRLLETHEAYEEMKARALTAESALAAAMEALKPFADLVPAAFDHSYPDNAQIVLSYNGQPHATLKNIDFRRASAIRAAVSTKTAESGHSPSTHNSESE